LCVCAHARSLSAPQFEQLLEVVYKGPAPRSQVDADERVRREPRRSCFVGGVQGGSAARQRCGGRSGHVVECVGSAVVERDVALLHVWRRGRSRAPRATCRRLHCTRRVVATHATRWARRTSLRCPCRRATRWGGRPLTHPHRRRASHARRVTKQSTWTRSSSPASCCEFVRV
jgi:hypothetical protein